MKHITRDIIGMSKVFLSMISIFLILFGIHWVAILSGVILGAVYFAIPKSYVN